MATAFNRGSVATSGVDGTSLRSSGLLLTGLALLLVLLAAMLVQARQFSMLRQAVRGDPEYSVTAVYQAEFEYQRLLQQWSIAAEPTYDTIDARALQLRYDIWVSRITLLQAGNVSRLVDADEENRLALSKTLTFISRADQVLGATDPGVSRQPLTRAFLVAELPGLKALAVPLHDLTLHAVNHVAQQAEERTARVREQNLIGLGLTGFLSLLTLTFAAVAIRQLRNAQQRRQALEDLTQRLAQAQQTAEAASATKSEFLAHMSHEVRTPFHGLIGMLSLLRETGLTAQQAGYLRTATESADHLLAVLNDILDLSQLESGRLRLAPSAVDLRALLRDVEALTRPMAVARGLSFHLDTAPDVPEMAQIDALRVRQILFNLLSNAIKFTERGAVAMELRFRAADEQASALEFSVSDTGPGMTAERVARLFDGLDRDPRHYSNPNAGAGLGLEIARKLARAMDGDITVRSEPGKGSNFILRLPMIEAVARAQSGVLDDVTPAVPPRRLHVLVAEDHPVNRQYMAELLDTMGHHCEFAAHGEEALTAARDRAFDLVLMDLHMPVMDGVDAARAIRALPDTARSTVPIVALTADAFEETRDRCMVAGMNGFLSKPVKPDMLATTLRRLFGPTGLTAARAVNGLPGVSPPAKGRDVSGAGPHGTSDHPAAQPNVDEKHVDLVDMTAVNLLLQALSRPQYAALAAQFLSQAPHTARHLRAAVRDGLPLDVRANAHAAKGAALNLGLARLAATAQALQEGAAHLPAHEIARLVQRYEDQIVATRDALNTLGLLGLNSETTPAAT